MRKKEFIFACIFALVVGFILCTSMFKKRQIPPLDTVTINEIIKLTEQNWNRLDSKTYSTIHIPFTVINLDGSVLYSTENSQSSTYSEHFNKTLSNRDFFIDIIINDELIGKLIIRNDMSTVLLKEKKQLERTILTLYVYIILIVLAYFLYLEKKIFRPFQKLKQFASSIASGNLEAPMTMDKRNLFGAFSESFDLMREALKTSRHNEYLANKSKKELVASLSHDIKNPVASIKAICETLALKSDDRYITTIHQKTEQIDRLISDMFQSTLEELGELKVKNEEYSSAILLETIDNVNYYHKINIVSDLPQCMILCDSLRLTQVFDNILGNSYKYAGTNINISFQIDTTHLRIFIKDFGTGIKEDDLPLVFEKFYRGKNSEGKEGSGLGLYISKLFIEKMGGQIECMNESDGFLVKFELKLAGSIL
jgi:signal transduction histidine kinase